MFSDIRCFSVLCLPRSQYCFSGWTSKGILKKDAGVKAAKGAELERSFPSNHWFSIHPFPAVRFFYLIRVFLLTSDVAYFHIQCFHQETLERWIEWGTVNGRWWWRKTHAGESKVAKVDWIFSDSDYTSDKRSFGRITDKTYSTSSIAI